MKNGNEAAVTRSVGAEPSPDSALMARVREGEVGLLGELFERHHRALFNFFSRLMRDRAVAEDLVQEVFVRMLKYRHTYRSDGELVPWMYALARNAATDFHRARPRELPEDPEAPDPEASGPLPVETLQRAEQTRTLKRALDRLPADRRETILLARFSGLGYDQIGELLGISEVAVKGRVHRAMGDLKKAYRAEGLRTIRGGSR
jgi:RNA polymerase sigma factor (sigma-70 family)